LAIVTFTVSCRPENIYTENDAHLEFSLDTVMFDTVFTTIGSATKRFKVYNPYDEAIIISSIDVAKGNGSNFKINVNGTPGNSAKDVELAGNDSLFVFVEVNIDPGRDEMLESDSVVFKTNGNMQDIKLAAYGQDVHLINDSVVRTTTWQNDKPYLIYNSMAVDSGEVLTIEQGTQLHFHRGSQMYVVGTLNVNGTVEEPVVFQGDRLEYMYDDVPGQWKGIWITKQSKDNVINHAEIKNAVIGIQVDSVGSNYPMLSIHNSVIQHHSFAGIYTQLSAVFATNCVIADCGYYAVALTRGGQYWFYHCTIANYWRNTVRQTPSLLLSNYLEHDESVLLYGLSNAEFKNCILYGNVDTEMYPDNKYDVEYESFNYIFENCMLKIDPELEIDTEDTKYYKNIILNQSPSFVDTENYKFELDTLSPAKDSGNPQLLIDFSNLLNFDILGNPRSITEPDLGAYERLE